MWGGCYGLWRVDHEVLWVVKDWGWRWGLWVVERGVGCGGSGWGLGYGGLGGGRVVVEEYVFYFTIFLLNDLQISNIIHI